MPLSPSRLRPLVLRLRRQLSFDWDAATILQFSILSMSLVPWLWPINAAGERIFPDILWFHRLTHEFEFPICFCTDGRRRTESRICRATDGTYSGQWVAVCATGSCGYFVALEQHYGRNGTLIKRYPLRDPQTIPGTPILRIGNAAATVDAPVAGGPVRHERRVSRRPRSSAGITTLPPPIQRDSTVLSRILKLDVATDPGLPKDVFDQLFTICACGMVTTRRVFHRHHCSRVEVIDLTEDSDDEESES